MKTLICYATPTTGPNAGLWLCGRESDHAPGLHLDIGERGAWNTGTALHEHIQRVVTAALAQAIDELGAADPDGPAPLAGAIHARAVELAALTLGIPKEALS